MGPTVHHERCDGCGICVEVCSRRWTGGVGEKTSCIKVLPTENGFEVKGCLECGKCAQACAHGAIRKNLLGIYKIDPKKCVGCGVCIAACPDRLMFLYECKAVKCDKCRKCPKACPQKVFTHGK